ncbi:UDP-3-O-acyl-N-acetylglucosamine deacetylase [Dactylococcopsis salina]|uniref:UDP-3-O-acyl-N-acetylglucosamine deacetylase n=1 Tax=Dactylococcopsis salina (strain PCC 8305) TaxID=13035 RepID=K9YX95_DACS8|nr:UDP-3-O-acyl-N-acetylglucosamine deacetylase [Dactylococcopsis salina]AFZ51544.1 UDP-3-0-acyl N-acetylglucosamine deacetylase [Dactylococcopsis salina PCC 8305]
MNQEQQTTIDQSFSVSGIGLHSGEAITVTVKSAAANEGRYFVRTDLPEHPMITATVNAVSRTEMSTELANGQAKVRTVEHLLSALVGEGVDNARIEINGSEVPLLDGSAKTWVEKIQQAGLTYGEKEKLSPLRLNSPVWVQEKDAIVAAFPATETQLSYGIDFPVSAIGEQWKTWHPHRESYHSAIAPARTFVLAEQIEALRQGGLIKGGSLENALVCNETGWLNPPLRFANEPVRHKLLDLVGDLSLLGTLPQAHIFAYKASHRLHIRLAQQLATSTCTIDN